MGAAYNLKRVVVPLLFIGLSVLSAALVASARPVSATPMVPVLVGWGAVRLDETSPGSGGTPSAVFSGESASDMELLLIELKAKGYDTVRVHFDPYCTDTVDYNYMSVYSQTNAERAVAIAKYYGFWIIIDYHGYSDIFRNTSCWLSYWQPIVQSIGPLYSQIIWEPENEPDYGDCTNSPSSCPFSPCSSDASCVTYLGSAYQQWIDQARSLGDTHWIVVQNLCSYACGFSDMSQGYPTVTDPLGTMAQGGKLFISLHSYMDYNQYSGSWNNATAEAVANQYYQAVVAGVSNTGWPALNTEGGTDTLSCDPNFCGPDIVLNGSAGYTVVTFHFIQTLVNLYDSNTPQRINWVWWPAGSWTNTPGSGVYGAMTCDSNPIGWGCLLNFTPFTIVSYHFPLITAPGNQTATVGGTLHFTVSASNPSGATGTLTLTASGLVPNMSFDPATGAFSFTPSSAQAGKTFTVNFTATNSNNPAWTSTQSVPINVENTSTSNGACLTCPTPSGLTGTMWLLVIGGVIGIVSSLALLHTRTKANREKARKRMEDARMTNERSQTMTQLRGRSQRPRTTGQRRNTRPSYQD